MLNLVIKDRVQPNTSFNVIVCLCWWNTAVLISKIVLILINCLIHRHISLLFHCRGRLRLIITSVSSARIDMVCVIPWIIIILIHRWLTLVAPARLIKNFDDLSSLLPGTLVNRQCGNLHSLNVLMFFKSSLACISAHNVSEFWGKGWVYLRSAFTNRNVRVHGPLLRQMAQLIFVAKQGSFGAFRWNLRYRSQRFGLRDATHCKLWQEWLATILAWPEAVVHCSLGLCTNVRDLARPSFVQLLWSAHNHRRVICSIFLSVLPTCSSLVWADVLLDDTSSCHQRLPLIPFALLPSPGSHVLLRHGIKVGPIDLVQGERWHLLSGC